MPRTILGPGAHSGTVGEIQRALLAAGFDPDGTDGIYGQDTTAAVKAFQRSERLPTTGIVDDVTWQALMQKPVPATDVRSLELTAAFEGHGYTLAVGNFDGAWLTWGIIGFTLKYGQIQKILININSTRPQIIAKAFGDNAGEILRVMNSSPQEQEHWANAVTVEGRLAEPWRTDFDRLGRFPEIMEEQRRVAREGYFVPSLNMARSCGLKTELGLALCFDIQVQNGGIKEKARTAIQQVLSQNSPFGEQELRRIIANAVADDASPKYKEDVRQRKLTIANGAGTVHKYNYVLENWGLSEAAAPELG